MALKPPFFFRVSIVVQLDSPPSASQRSAIKLQKNQREADPRISRRPMDSKPERSISGAKSPFGLPVLGRGMSSEDEGSRTQVMRFILPQGARSTVFGPFQPEEFRGPLKLGYKAAEKRS